MNSKQVAPKLAAFCLLIVYTFQVVATSAHVLQMSPNTAPSHRLVESEMPVSLPCHEAFTPAVGSEGAGMVTNSHTRPTNLSSETVGGECCDGVCTMLGCHGGAAILHCLSQCNIPRSTAKILSARFTVTSIPISSLFRPPILA